MINNFNGTDIFGPTLLNNFVAKLNQEFALHMKIGGTEYNNLVNSINTKNSSQDTEIGNIKTAATALTTRVTTAEGKVSALETNFTNLNSSHNGLTTTVGGLTTSLGEVQTTISSINNEITGAKTRLTNLETTVGSLNDNLNDVSGMIDSKVATATTELNNRVNLLDEEKAEVAHTHAWADLISGLPAFATRWPTWTEVTDKVEATTTVQGLMSAADKTKLNGIAASANNYSHPTGDGNLHVPATSTTNNGKVLKAGATAGSIAWGFADWTEIANKPSAMPASDVYAWAKAGTKPSYTPSEVGAFPSTGGTVAGPITFSADYVLEWVRNTDYSRIGFKNDSDADADSFMYFEVGDNVNEYFKWRNRVTAGATDLMWLKPDGVLDVKTNIRINGNNVYHEGRKPTFAEISTKPTTLNGYGITDALGLIVSSDTTPDALVLKGVYFIADADKSFVTVNSSRVTGTETTAVTQTKIPTEGISKPCWRKGTGNPIVWGNWEFLGGFDGKGKADIVYNEGLNSIDFKIITT